MAVYTHNLTIISGADYSQDYDMLETGGGTIDLTNYTAKAQLRKHKGSATAVSFTVAFPNRIEGKINMSIPSWTTGNLKEGRYVYDVLIGSGSSVYRIVSGDVLVIAGISSAPS